MTTRTKSKANRSGVGSGQSVCAHCKKPIPDFETARTSAPPPGQAQLPAGCGWVICGEDCIELPSDALVFYRNGVGRKS